MADTKIPNLASLGLKYNEGQLLLLDQQQLPNHEEWMLIESSTQMIDAIKKLKVRGAPLIGVAAVMSLAVDAVSGANREQLAESSKQLRAARPTAVNLMWALDQWDSLLGSDATVAELCALSASIFKQDQQLCEGISNSGAELISDGDTILTHCNTGGLATTGAGTALGIIKKAHEQGKKIHVYVDETRPLLQGGRLTTWELEKAGVPYTLICDNMAAFLMSQGKVSKVIVGSDRIAANGDFANKIGTYGLAVSCFYHRVPFYVAAPTSTLDLECSSGTEIPIEQRDDKEVRGVKVYKNEKLEQVLWAKESEVYNPAFDVTPNELTQGWILESGVYTQADIKSGAFEKL